MAVVWHSDRAQKHVTTHEALLFHLECPMEIAVSRMHNRDGIGTKDQMDEESITI